MAYVLIVETDPAKDRQRARHAAKMQRRLALIWGLHTERRQRLKEICDQLSSHANHKYTKYIYALIDPRTDKIVYYGNTRRPGNRYALHLRDSQHCRTDLHKLIYRMARDGCLPRMRVILAITSVDGSTDTAKMAANFVERLFIAKAEDNGLSVATLANMTDNPKKISV